MKTFAVAFIVSFVSFRMWRRARNKRRSGSGKTFDAPGLN